MKSHAVRLIAILLLALSVRLVNLAQRPMISKDGVLYVQMIEKGSMIPVHEYPQPLYFTLARPLHLATGLSAEASGHAITIFFGLLCVAITYTLGMMSGGPWMAAVASTLYAIHPHTVLMDSDVSNSSLATFWALLSVISISKALRNNSLAAMLVCPGLALLAVLSRREGVALLPLMFLVPVLSFALSSAPRFRHLFLPSFRFILVGGAVTAVSLMVSAKLFPPFAARLYDIAVSSSWTIKSAEASGISPQAIAEYLHDAVRSVFIPILPFSLLGMVVAKRQFRNSMLAYVSFIFLICAFGIVLVRTLVHGADYASSRYFLISIPFVLLFASAGVIFVRQWLQSRNRPRWAMIAVAAIFLPCMAYVVFPPHRSEAPYREAAEYIRAAYGSGKTVASSRSQIAYYARATYASLPEKPEDLSPSQVDWIVLRSGDYLDKLTRMGKAKKARQFGPDVWLLEPVK